jgi:FtsP/CotA-like multicopper oxidase with cupredoxin domain
MAGFYLVKQSSLLGTEPDRWGLDKMTEYNLMLADKVLDGSCQLRYEPEGVHRNSHFGDINLVSGIPFPRLEAEPKWVRFRLLNAAVARPYLLSLVNAQGQEVSSKHCYVSDACSCV